MTPQKPREKERRGTARMHSHVWSSTIGNKQINNAEAADAPPVLMSSSTTAAAQIQLFVNCVLPAHYIYSWLAGYLYMYMCVHVFVPSTTHLYVMCAPVRCLPANAIPIPIITLIPPVTYLLLLYVITFAGRHRRRSNLRLMVFLFASVLQFPFQIPRSPSSSLLIP